MTAVILILLPVTIFSAGFEDLRLDPAENVTEAELHYVTPFQTNSVAVLILLPGCNGNGKTLIQKREWLDYAASNKLELASVSFKSDVDQLKNGKGYYYPDQGSGSILLKAIDSVYGGNIPLILYGFSGGAHFVSRFAEWRLGRVVAWCAYSAGWWDEPNPSEVIPPGIVACGEDDERLGASLTYFKQGRAAERPWLWIGVPENGHSPDSRVEAFARDYFSAVLNGMAEEVGGKNGLWVDVETRTIADEKIGKIHPTGTGWLPDARLFSAWQSLGKASRQGAKTQSFETNTLMRTVPAIFRQWADR